MALSVPRFRPRLFTFAVFLGTMCALAAALTWLCWRLLEQDRQLESQRVQERLEQAADRTASVFESGVGDLDRWLVSPEARRETPPEGVALLAKTEGGVIIRPPGRLLYLPPATPGANTVDRLFSAGEVLEFRERDSAGAAAVFRNLSQSPNPEVRAGALVRLGRNLRKLGRYTEALDVYRRLELAPNVVIEGTPAGLLALSARCSVLESLGRRDALRKEALVMDAGLRTCRWSLPGAVWDFHREQASRWAGTDALTLRERQALALSRAAEWACQLWPHPLDPKGRRILRVDDGPALISWMEAPAGLAAVLAGPERLEWIWKQAYLEKSVHAALVDADGSLLMGSLDKNARQVARRAAAPGLAATLLFTPADVVADHANSNIRRRLLLAGFAVLALVLVSGSYFILRSMARERAVARLQSEFVSAVSHELRTPLTSLRQVSELLVNGRIAREPERRQSYEILFHASRRLQRLVESLLDFGRMEASAFRYRFDQVDLRELVDGVVEDFRGQSAREHVIVLSHAEELPAIRADRDAIAVLLWNLLDNAVKYSPGRPAVWVETKREGQTVYIAVRDRGFGIERGEQDRVFEKFVRGAAAQKSNIQGTGIGLSIARHIVRAHGGDIRLESVPGEGSTFTIAWPAEPRIAPGISNTETTPRDDAKGKGLA
jgi:signal transduction histidine kinase